MPLATVLSMLFSVIVPAKMWYGPTAPLNLTVTADGDVTLTLIEFHSDASKAPEPLEPKGDANVPGGKPTTVDARALFPALARPGAYLLLAVPKGKTINEFVGTPVVITVRADKRAGGGADELIVVKMEPLRYLQMSTDLGEMTWIFWFDVAPNTSSHILDLASQGFYDGLTYHRVVPGFVIQGGDPRGDGLGGPGYQINAEFSDRKHVEGILSMARSGDPLERQGMRPRPEFANSAGSQFFVVLAPAEHLNGKYTAFGQVTEGVETVRAIAAVELADKQSGRPAKPPVIKKVEVKTVTAQKNPYAAVIGMKKEK